MLLPLISFFFFFNDTATTEIYTLSLHDALPIYGRVLLGIENFSMCSRRQSYVSRPNWQIGFSVVYFQAETGRFQRSEEHTSELQSRLHLVCRLLLEKKKKNKTVTITDDTKD